MASKQALHSNITVGMICLSKNDDLYINKVKKWLNLREVATDIFIGGDSILFNKTRNLLTALIHDFHGWVFFIFFVIVPWCLP